MVRKLSLSAFVGILLAVLMVACAPATATEATQEQPATQEEATSATQEEATSATQEEAATATQEETEASAEPVTLQYWTWFPPLPTTEKMIAAFEKENPNIKVEINILESMAYQDKLPLSLADGEPIDVVAVQTSTMVNQVKEYLQPLPPLLEENVGPDWADQVNPKAIEQSRLLADDGEMYILPMGSLGSVVAYYNVDIFNEYGLEVPTNLAEFQALADTLHEKNPDIMPVVFTGANWFQDEIVLTLIGQTSPSFFNDIRYGDGRWDDPKYVQTLKTYAGMYDSGIFSKDVLDMDYGRALEVFYTGKAAILLQGTWEAGILSEKFRTDNGIELNDVGLMPLPVIEEGGTPSIRSFIELGMAIPKSSQHPKEAMKLLQFIVLGDGINEWGPAFIEVPSKLGYEPDAALLTSDAARDGYNTLVELIQNPSSDRNNVSAFSAVVGDGIIEILNGGDPEEVAKHLQEEWESGRYLK